MKKTIAISLALLILVSNVGFSMNTHFCGGKVVKTSFTIGLHNPDCGMAKMDQVCVDVLSTEYHLSKKSCCDNQHQILQLDENVNIKTGKISVNPIFFVSFIHSFTQPLFFAEHTLAHSADYYPPIPDWGDMQVLFQTFLI